MRLSENSRPVLRAAAGAGAPAETDDDGAADGSVDDGGISCVGSTAAGADRRDDDADVMDCASPFSRLPIATLHCTQTLKPSAHYTGNNDKFTATNMVVINHNRQNYAVTSRVIGRYVQVKTAKLCLTHMTADSTHARRKHHLSKSNYCRCISVCTVLHYRHHRSLTCRDNTHKYFLQ